MWVEATATVAPEVGSEPGWPLVLYFHHVRADIDHYTVLSPAELSLALDLVGVSFRPLDPHRLGEVGADPPAEPRCLLTFDDGYLDVWEEAVPILEAKGWRAILFVSTGLVGTVERHPVRGPLEHMSWSQLRELDAHGHLVASHGHSHRDMGGLGPAAARAEVTVARDRLAAAIGTGPVPLAYPYGNRPEDLEPLAEVLPPLCFGSVKASPAAWSRCPRLIRRTYLPSGEPDRWPELVAGWRRQWETTASR